ncbi:MAG TPA: hypothetical protein PKA41_04485 [Verrucomicrobiota bacterium]|nr:hypothetical protein [Verrucomicrobiota bacterium]
MAQREYIRLTRSHARSGLAVIIAWRSSLWLAKDHLLCVDTNGYMENYKRFYFRDIQAVSIRKTQRALYWSLVLGGIAAFCAVIASIASPGFDVFFWIVAGIFFLLLALNLLGGPSCVCHLKTAVQTEEMAALNRIRRARKILKRIRPLIESAQGRVETGQLPALMQQLARGELSFTPSSAAIRIPADMQPRTNE